MKVKVKATGEVIEVKGWKGSSDVFFTTPDMNHFYQAEDIVPIENEPMVMVSRLNEVLNEATEVGYINQYGAHRILDLIKPDIIFISGKEDNFPTNEPSQNQKL